MESTAILEPSMIFEKSSDHSKHSLNVRTVNKQIQINCYLFGNKIKI